MALKTNRLAVPESISIDNIQNEKSDNTITTSTSPMKKRLSSIRRNSFISRAKSSIKSAANSRDPSPTPTPSRSTSDISSSSSSISQKTATHNNEQTSGNNNDNNNNNTGSSKKRTEFYQDFKDLEQELTRFLSKTGMHKSNVLRLALLPFLRQQRGEGSIFSIQCDREANFRIKVLQKWWLSILEALRDKSNPVSGSDRSAYLEAISGIMARSEWTLMPKLIESTCQKTKYIYESLLYDTVKLVISKLSVKTVPLSMAAFSGKVLAFAFFYAPGVAAVLLHLLQISATTVDRLLQVSVTNHQELETCCNQIKDKFPIHLSRLIGTKGVGMTKKMNDGSVKLLRPKAPPQLTDLYGPWARRWHCDNSNVFTAFVKHYYTIMSQLLVDTDSQAHLASPGLIIIQCKMLNELDSVVRPQNNNNNSSMNNKFIDDNINTHAIMANTFSTKQRVERIKLLSAIREILHNDDVCVQYYETFSRQFGKILHAVALRTKLYNVESCIVLADLVEEYLGSLILEHSLSKHRVQIEKDNAIDWPFWIKVVSKMLSSDNSHTELRALTLLFNLWDDIPIGNAFFTSNSKSEDELDQYLASKDGLRWGCTCWLLSDNMWKQYFCHWQPLVRCYYQRLICWRVASVGDLSQDENGALLSNILFSNYNMDARILLKKKLDQSHLKISDLIENAKMNNQPIPNLKAAPPIVNRKLTIVNNNLFTFTNENTKTTNGFSTPTTPNGITTPNGSNMNSGPQRMNVFDVFDDIAYSYPTSMPPSELFPTDNSATRKNSEETVRKQVPPVPPIPQQQQQQQAHQKITDNSISSTPSTWQSIKQKIFGKFTATEKLDPPPQVLRNYHSSSELASSSSSPPSSSSFSNASTPPSFSHTPVGGSSGASSTSTPPSPRSVKSLSFSDSNNNNSSKISLKSSLKKKRSSIAPPKTSLTMHLIPPPPQLLRAKPEICRPTTRFALEFCEKAAQRQRNVLNGLVIKKDRDEKLMNVNKPRLPFEQKDDEEEEEEEYEKITKDNFDDIRYWKYAGRSLSEWNEAVVEFESHVRQYRMIGATRLEDVSMPLMVAEVPAKVIKAG